VGMDSDVFESEEMWRARPSAEEYQYEMLNKKKEKTGGGRNQETRCAKSLKGEEKKL